MLHVFSLSPAWRYRKHMDLLYKEVHVFVWFFSFNITMISTQEVPENCYFKKLYCKYYTYTFLSFFFYFIGEFLWVFLISVLVSKTGECFPANERLILFVWLGKKAVPNCENIYFYCIDKDVGMKQMLFLKAAAGPNLQIWSIFSLHLLTRSWKHAYMGCLFNRLMYFLMRMHYCMHICTF